MKHLLVVFAATALLLSHAEAQTKRPLTLNTKAATLPVLLIPYLPRTGAHGMQGVLSIENYGDVDVEVEFSLYDDYGTHVADTTVSVRSGYTQWINSWHLEHGNADRGETVTPRGQVRGSILWATLVQPARVQVLAYARDLAGGYVVPMSRTANHRRREGGTWAAYLPFFNPASNGSVRTTLRLMNPTDTPRELVLFAWDRDGVRTPDILCTAPTFGVISLTAEDLEGGSSESPCSSLGWGDGAGKWFVQVEDTTPREEPLIVMAPVHYSQQGLLANASFPALTYLGEEDGTVVPVDVRAPADAAAFWALVEGQKMVLWLVSGQWAEFRFTSFQEMEGNPYISDNGYLSARFSSGHQISGDWKYTKSRVAAQAALEVDFFAGVNADFYLICDIALLFTGNLEGRLSANCPTSEGGFPGGSGTFQIQGLF